MSFMRPTMSICATKEQYDTAMYEFDCGWNDEKNNFEYQKGDDNFWYDRGREAFKNTLNDKCVGEEHF